jgi:hypothetical protein
VANENYYSIHGIVNFIVVDNTRLKLFDTFYKHYQNFEIVDKPEKIDLIINLGSFDPETRDKYVVAYGNYYVNQNYFYVKKESYKGAEWTFEAIGLEESTTTLNINFNKSGRMFVTGNVIDFFIHFKLLNKSCPLIHASGISKDDNGIIFSGRGGSGKTSIAFEFLKNKFNFLGDNYLVLTNNAILSYPTSLSLFTYNLNQLIIDNLSLKEKISIIFKNFIYKLSRGHAKFFTKINPNRIVKKVSESSTLKKVFLINPIENFSEEVLIKEIDREYAIKKILYNQKLEFTFFNQYIEMYSFFYPNEQLSKHWELYEKNIDTNISKELTFYEVLISSNFNRTKIIGKIEEYIE